MLRVSAIAGAIVLSLAIVAGCAHGLGQRDNEIPLPQWVQDSVRTIARALDARVSVTALHLERHESLRFAPRERVFMSSVVKLPIVVQLLARVDRGELRLQDSVTLQASDMRIGNAGLAAEYPQGGVTLSIRQLVTRGIAQSDNSAADALLRYSGGPTRVMEELRRLGITRIRVDRSYAENTWRYHGITNPPPTSQWSPSLFDSLAQAAPALARTEGARQFLADTTNRAASEDLAALLQRLWLGDLLSPASRAVLLHDMTVSENPATRLVAGVPHGSVVAHKTGTWGTWQGQWVADNDVGVITLPQNRGHVVLAVMIGAAHASTAVQDGVIRDITRLLCSYWMQH